MPLVNLANLVDMIVNMHDAKTNLSQLVKKVEEGEEVIIARAGEPVARLVRYERTRNVQFGTAKGEMWVADDWDSDEFNAEIAAMFYGDE